MKLQDYHLHTTFSCDAKSPMVDMCQSAVDIGLKEIGFAEHYDLNPVDACYLWFQIDAWQAELERCRDLFAGKLTIRAGIEFSEPHTYSQGLDALLKRYAFDYVIGSLHYLGDELIFFDQYYLKRGEDQAYLDYFSELQNMISCGNFDILGHLDILSITAKLIFGHYDPVCYEASIRGVLQNLINHNIVPEINTQGLRKPAQILVPGADILKWYVEMGGVSICLGSDAHTASHVGLNLEDAVSAARQAGLKNITYFAQRQRRLTPLPEID